jgi:large subunit ribosomal protein L15
MRLNTLKPAQGAKQNFVRLGRGCGSGLGKTCGRGHKGQRARSGWHGKTGFEGGQLPLQRRLPKFGFTPLRVNEVAEVLLSELQKIKATKIDLAALKSANLVSNNARQAKIILSGSIKKAFTIVDIKVTAGAKKAIEAAGGKIETTKA